MMSLFGAPIRQFDPTRLREEMLNAPSGTIFVIGKKNINHHEGDDTVEYTFAIISKSADPNDHKGIIKNVLL